MRGHPESEAALDDRLVNESDPARKAQLGSQELTDVGRRIIRLWRAEGSLRLASIALRLATSPLLEYGRVVFFVRELDNDHSWPKAPMPDGLEIRQAHVSEIPKLISAGRADRTLAALRFRRGDQCVVVVDGGGQILHNRWVTVMPTPIPELLRDIIPRHDEAYFYDGYTRPEARSLGLDGVVRSFIFDTLRAAHYARVYSYVRGDNSRGLRAASRWQACVGELWFIRFRRLGAWIVSQCDADGSNAAAWPDLGDATAAWPI
jgi:hypothetical protein